MQPLDGEGTQGAAATALALSDVGRQASKVGKTLSWCLLHALATATMMAATAEVLVHV